MDEIEFTMTKHYKITKDRIFDLLTCAFEGGSNYWYCINKYVYPEGKTRKDYEFPYLQLPLDPDGGVLIDSFEDKEHSGKLLTLNRIGKGLRIMAEKEQQHFEDFINENEDAVTGDVFLQLCLFEEVIYG